MNVVAIYFNGQRMPVKGITYRDELHAPLNDQTRFPFFCDIIDIDFKFFNGVASIGDILIAIGFCIVLATVFTIDR